MVERRYLPTASDDDTALACGAIPDRLSVHVYGRNTDVDAAEDIWNGGGNYTGFPATADTVEVLSSSANDAAAGTGARTVRLYYLDASGIGFDANDEFLFRDVILNGATPVSAGISALRVWKAQVITAGSGLTNAGDITVRQVGTPTNIFAVIPTGFSLSSSSAFTIPLGWTGWMADFDATLNDNTANQAVLCIKTLDGGVQTLEHVFGLDTGSPYTHRPHGRTKLTELTDVVFRALSVQNANADISISWSMFLIKNQRYSW